LETAANPYAAVLGPQETAGIRLNLAAAFNGSAAFVAAIIGRNFILSGVEYTPEQLAAMPEAEKLAYLNFESSAVKGPYLVLAAGFVLVAVLFSLFHFPEVKSESKTARLSQFAKAFRHKHLSWAVLAQFAYVGAQVCITSFFIRMAQQGGGIDEKTAGWYLGVYGLLFMAGRFIGTFFLKYIQQQKLLTIYAVICTALCATAILIDGKFAVYALCGLGFFVSIMFPTIFALGIVDLGEDTKIGSSLLIMSIIGGAIFPYIMGSIIDMSNDNIQSGYIVPLLCFLLIIYFGVSGYKVREAKKGVELN
jgi:FHS family L-fucose permease-like MFS transporter